MLASEPQLSGVSGRYFDQGQEKAPGAKALDTDLAEVLWRRSAEWVGVD